MNKQSPIRILYNLVLIVIVVISVIATGLISVKGYRANRIPEMLSAKQIEKQIKQEYADFGFEKNDEWDIKTNLEDGNKTFMAKVNVTQTRELCEKNYVIQLLYELIEGKWKLTEVPDNLTLVKSKWLFEDSSWTVSTEEGDIYTLSLFSDFEAELSVTAHKKNKSEEQSPINVLDSSSNDESENKDIDDDNELANSDEETSTVADESHSSQKASCHLNVSEDEKSFTGDFWISEETSVSVVITEDTVKLLIGQEQLELIMKRE